MNRKNIVIPTAVALVLVFVIVLIVALTKSDGNVDNPSASVNETTTEPSEVSFQSQGGNYSVKITTVFESEPDPSTENPPKAERVAVVVYEYKNDGITDGLSISNTHFKAYDKRGRELEVYPQQGLFEPSEIGESGVFTASVAFALNNDNNYLKIEYYNDVTSKKPDATFEQTW